MTKLLKKLFSRSAVAPPFDIEKVIGHWLLSLPRCTGRVAVISSRYGDQRYRYELTVDTPALIEWLEENPGKRYIPVGDDKANVANLAMLLWLRGADLTNRSETYIPVEFFVLLKQYHSEFSSLAGVEIYCHECQRIVETINSSQANLPKEGIFDGFSAQATCPSGHILYGEEVRFHIHKRMDINVAELFK
ncbi:MAG: hypothetical protein KJ795_11710 [Gammaproteobacteria bacterium]|nr:hypothetical protein [Gammaproteobacteria bacterium]MBU1776950.1 hypothetical protein [Gammaproteobacteria bacterium]MBU1968683.1 hypothetical protein [Gammaproteobacteria bacterium]